MRAIIFSVITAVGIGMLGISGASAAPANGVAIGKAASTIDLTQDVRWWGPGWRGRGWRYGGGWGYGRRWCFYHPYRCR
jgi:hypothetical protein